MTTNETTQNAQTEEKEEMYYLRSGDVFTVDAVKVMRSKLYSNEIAKVLCAEGQQCPAPIVFSSASQIVQVLKEPWAIGEQFIVVQKGLFKGFPVLSLQSMNKEIQAKIARILF
jgi:hypothetical protein